MNISLPARGVHTGLPSWFRASCSTASRGLHDGYAAVGYSLGRALEHEVPDDLALDEWVDMIEEIDTSDDNDEAFAWLDAHLPKMLRLVPRRRRERFIAGFRRGRDEQR